MVESIVKQGDALPAPPPPLPPEETPPPIQYTPAEARRRQSATNASTVNVAKPPRITIPDKRCELELRRESTPPRDKKTTKDTMSSGESAQVGRGSFPRREGMTKNCVPGKYIVLVTPTLAQVSTLVQALEVPQAPRMEFRVICPLYEWNQERDAEEMRRLRKFPQVKVTAIICFATGRSLPAFGSLSSDGAVSLAVLLTPSSGYLLHDTGRTAETQVYPYLTMDYPTKAL